MSLVTSHSNTNTACGGVSVTRVTQTRTCCPFTQKRLHLPDRPGGNCVVSGRESARHGVQHVTHTISHTRKRARTTRTTGLHHKRARSTQRSQARAHSVTHSFIHSFIQVTHSARTARTRTVCHEFLYTRFRSRLLSTCVYFAHVPLPPRLLFLSWSRRCPALR